MKDSDIKIENKPPIDKLSLWGILIIVFFIGGFLLWAFLAKIESAAIAPGKIVVSGNRRVIQHLEGGIVSAIYVKNGQVVKKGELLLKIDDTQHATKYESEQGKVIRLLANEARLSALLQNKPKLVFPKTIMLTKKDNDTENFLQNQIDSFYTERAATNGQLSILEKRILQLQDQIVGVKAQLVATNKQLTLIKEELSAMIKLEKERLVDRSRVLSLQRERQRLKGLAGEYQAHIANLKQKIGETRLAIITEKDKFHKKWNEELRDIRDKLAIAKDKETSAKDIFQRTNIRSPIDGTVINLAFFTVGGVVKPGEKILEIVPKHEELVIEAKVNPLDIDVVKPGLLAKVSLSALKTRTTPTLLGKVTYVGADVKMDERTQTNFYEARIAISKTALKAIKQEKLYPGMPVEVMIITNELTPWEYFKDPIARSFNRAFRED